MTFPFAAASVIAAAPFIGCFGASAVQRRLEGKSFFFLRSSCDACGRQLGFRDLVPILSWRGDASARSAYADDLASARLVGARLPVQKVAI